MLKTYKFKLNKTTISINIDADNSKLFKTIMGLKSDVELCQLLKSEMIDQIENGENPNVIKAIYENQIGDILSSLACCHLHFLFNDTFAFSEINSDFSPDQQGYSKSQKISKIIHLDQYRDDPNAK